MFFQTDTHYKAHTDLKFTTEPRLLLTFSSSNLYHPILLGFRYVPPHLLAMLIFCGQSYDIW